MKCVGFEGMCIGFEVMRDCLENETNDERNWNELTDADIRRLRCEFELSTTGNGLSDAVKRKVVLQATIIPLFEK